MVILEDSVPIVGSTNADARAHPFRKPDSMGEILRKKVSIPALEKNCLTTSAKSFREGCCKELKTKNVFVIQ